MAESTSVPTSRPTTEPDTTTTPGPTTSLADDAPDAAAATASAAGRRDALAEQIFRATLGAQEVLHLHLGHKLGLYRVLAGVDSATAAELAHLAGIAPRYAREWLEQQAATGVLDVVPTPTPTPPATVATERRFRLPPGAAEVLVDPESLYLTVPMATLVVGIAQTMPKVVEAFRTGDGVAYELYGADTRDAIAELNRPMFTHQLATDWLPALPDIDARLRRSDPPALIGDLGCGSGWSTIALARAYPTARVEGIDVDDESIASARRNADAAGLGDRVRFRAEDAASPRLAGRYDLVTMFETLHDMNRPIDVLRGARGMLAPGGAVLVGDERVADEFAAPADELDRFNYGWSAEHCLPVGLTEPGAEGTGTVIRPDTVRDYAERAGFRSIERLPIEHDFWLFYRLDDTG